MKRYGVGYALAAKKQASFIQDSLINLATEKGIDLIKIDTTKPLIEQGPFDCVLHKLYGQDWKQQLRDYSSQNPTSLIIDSPDAIERLHDRVSMLEVVSELDVVSETASFGIPKQFVIYDAERVSEVDLGKQGLKFPVIAKPLVADGSAKSHKMSLVFNKDGLNELRVKPPIVLQEFVNHGGVIFKVYVVGDYVQCVKRKSLPDVSEENLGNLEGSLSFSQISNLNACGKNNDDKFKYFKMMNLEEVEEIESPPVNLITDIAKGLKKATRLHLFNFDVIRDAKVGNRYLVIDINYFPGYAKMPGYETVLTGFFRDVLSRNHQCSEGFKKVDRCENEVRLLVGDDKVALPLPLKGEEKENSVQV